MKDFKQYYIINTTPEILYRGLTYVPTIQLWTGEEAVMSTEPDTEFSLFGENIVGRNLEFVEGKKIVQQWYLEGTDETPSIVTILLHEHKQGTSVELRHSNIPDELYDEFVEGWNDTYFGALIDFYTE